MFGNEVFNVITIFIIVGIPGNGAHRLGNRNQSVQGGGGLRSSTIHPDVPLSEDTPPSYSAMLLPYRNKRLIYPVGHLYTGHTHLSE